MSHARFWLVALALVGGINSASAIPITQFNSALTENFDTLSNSTSASSVGPAGWTLFEDGSGGNTTYVGNNGSATGGNTYSYGATGSTERAFGTLRTGTVIPSIGALFTNNTGDTIGSVAIQYTGEQWRLGTLGRVDRLDFAYSFDASGLNNGTWQNVNELDFTAPLTAGVIGAKDGNVSANQVALSHTITGLALANGASIWLRWSDFDATGAEDGLAIDNFSLTAIKAPGQSVPDTFPMAIVGLLVAAMFVVRPISRAAAHS